MISASKPDANARGWREGGLNTLAQFALARIFARGRISWATYPAAGRCKFAHNYSTRARARLIYERGHEQRGINAQPALWRRFLVGGFRARGVFLYAGAPSCLGAFGGGGRLAFDLR